MPVTLLRLLTLFAFVVMPFGMAHGPAEAHAMPAAVDEHCGDHPDGQMPPTGDVAQCMLMCAALPAGDQLNVSPPIVPAPPPVKALNSAIHGIILEIATPPPRHG